MNLWFLKPEYRQRLGYHVVLLGGVALLTSAAIGVANHLTRADIAQRQQRICRSPCSRWFPRATITIWCTRRSGRMTMAASRWWCIGRGAQNRFKPCAIRSSAPGYGNTAMVIAIGVDRNGTLLGTRVISHNETPGLGDKIELGKSDWILILSWPLAE